MISETQRKIMQQNKNINNNLSPSLILMNLILLYNQMLIAQFPHKQLHQIQTPCKQHLRIHPVRHILKRSDFEDYQLKETLGTGGFGEVKKAIHKPTGQIVAVKVMTMKQFDSNDMLSFQREIGIQKNIMHQNIAQVFEVIRRDNKIYVFMEYCKNGELFDFINSHGPLSEKDAARIFNQILSALIYLKENQISHRDIKPENVLFDDQWNVKIIDFGFSCSNNGDFRRTVCGTPSYTPPEIIKKVPYNPELVDVWCLGVTLYAMLAAQLPFDIENQESIKSNILNCKYHIPDHFSHKATKLITSIFVEASYRPKLNDLVFSEFSLISEPINSKFINFKTENLLLETDVVKILSTDYHLDASKVADSVINCRFDKFYAMYYLTLKKEQQTHEHTKDRDVSQFKKRRRNSLIKLDPLTPNLKKLKKTDANDLINLKLIKDEPKKLTKIIRAEKPTHRRQATLDSSAKVRRSDSADSPRKLLYRPLLAYK